MQLFRTIREGRAFLRYLQTADLQRDWTLEGAIAMGAVFASGRKDLYAAVPVHAKNTPDKPAIVEGGKVLTYADLERDACRFANGLAERGVRRRDKVVVAFGNAAETLVAVTGAAHLGAVIVPSSPSYKEKELGHIVTNSDARLVCVTHKQWQAIGGSSKQVPDFLQGRTVVIKEGGEGAAIGWRELLSYNTQPPKRERTTQDPSMMLYTSGTTGKPKGAALNMQRVSYVRAFQLIGACGFGKNARFYTACPAYHAAPTAFIGFALATGGTVHLDDKFDAERTWRYLDEAEITIAFMVPTQIVRLLSAVGSGKKPRALERIISSGAALAAPVKQRALQSIGPIYDLYGATELGLVTLGTPEEMRDNPGTIGRPLPGVDVRFFDDDGKDVPTGQRGALYVRSDQFDFGYYKNADATRAASTGDFRTVGDIGYEDRGGFLYIVDRKSDMIISGGVNIYPAEIEQELLEHPAIEDAAVVGIPDAEWGESVAAFIVARAGQTLSAEQVVQHCATRLSGPKKPKRVEFLSEIPRSPQGKILKRELRERLA